MQTPISITDPSISFRKYFSASVQDYGYSMHIVFEGKFIEAVVPNYDEVIRIYLRHNYEPEGWSRKINFIRWGYAFIWDGLKNELETCSVPELKVFAKKLEDLQALKNQYEQYETHLSIRHDDEWVRMPTPLERQRQDEEGDGTPSLRSSTAMRGAAWLIGETTTLISYLLQEHKPADTKTEKNTQRQYKSFSDLFISHDDINLCVEVLKKYEKNRTRNGEFRKCVVIAWIDYLHDIKKIHTNDFKLVAPVLVTEFLGFTIGRRTTYDTPKCRMEAKNHFIMNIPH